MRLYFLETDLWQGSHLYQWQILVNINKALLISPKRSLSGSTRFTITCSASVTSFWGHVLKTNKDKKVTHLWLKWKIRKKSIRYLPVLVRCSYKQHFTSLLALAATNKYYFRGKGCCNEKVWVGEKKKTKKFFIFKRTLFDPSQLKHKNWNISVSILDYLNQDIFNYLTWKFLKQCSVLFFTL